MVLSFLKPIEYLLLAGDYCGHLQLLDTSRLSRISSDGHQEIMNRELKETNTVFERPFWLFAESEACEQFHFFYLDDGDNPAVYLATYGLDDGDDIPKRMILLNSTFSEYIDKRIDVAIKYRQGSNYAQGNEDLEELGLLD